MSLKVLGRDNSANVQPVLIALSEMGLAYERHDYGGKFGKVRDGEYLAMNPNALVPTLIDGTLSVWESNAILRYLANRYGPTPMYPNDPATRSHVDRWMDWRQTTFAPVIGPLFWGYIRTPEAERDLAALAKMEATCCERAAILDAQLGRNVWVAGDFFSFADVSLSMMVRRYCDLPFQTARPVLPNLDRWMKAIRARPSIKQFADAAMT